jgi:sulfur carrier protein
MRIVLNGEPRELPESSSVTDAVAATGAAPGGRGVAVAVDGEVVPRGEWDTTVVQAEQSIEVLQAVQGG